MAIVFPVHETPARPHKQALHHLKQIGLGTNIYLADFDDRFPPDTSSVSGSRAYLMPYIKNDEIMRSVNPGHPEFLGNGSLAWTKVDDPTDLHRTVLYFDSAPWKEGDRAVVFVDTSTRMVQEPRFQDTVANGWLLAPVAP